MLSLLKLKKLDTDRGKAVATAVMLAPGGVRAHMCSAMLSVEKQCLSHKKQASLLCENCYVNDRVVISNL